MKYLIAFMILALASVGNAASSIHWIHPSGTAASWAACATDTDPACGSPYACYCALGYGTGQLNKEIVAGDTAYLKAGSGYSWAPGGASYSAINPWNHDGTLSGSTCTAKITIQNAPGETPEITQTNYASLSYAILIGDAPSGSGASHCVKVSGIKFKDFGNNFAQIVGGGHNEITGCTFYTSTPISSGAAAVYVTNSTHNWIHGNTVSKMGYSSAACVEGGDAVQFDHGATNTDSTGYNTFENNDIANGGHGTMAIRGASHNVIRNNRMQDTPWHSGNSGSCGYPATYTNSAYNGLYGHRDFIIDNYWDQTTLYTLVEGNRFGYGSTNPNNPGANNYEIEASTPIIRYNYSFGAMQDGLLFKYVNVNDHILDGYNGGGKNNRVFNNTFYYNGYGYTGLTYDQRHGMTLMNGADSTGTNGPSLNVIVNNLLYSNANGDISLWNGDGSADPTTYYDVRNNWCSTAKSWCSLTNYGNPSFTDTTLTPGSIATLPNLIPGNASVHDGGTYLTTVSTVNSQTSIVVADALYFQDGTWGSDLARGALGNFYPDQIAIGTVGNIATISAINYSTNTITLASAPASTIVNTSGQNHVWLYKKSDGTQVLYGTAPDYGAYEYVTGGGTSLAPLNGVTIIGGEVALP
jgi:hypothetical protein